jgi:hypothetical protein
MANIKEFIFLHDVKFKKSPEAETINGIGKKKDLEAFISSIIKRRLKEKGTRSFKKRDDSTAVISYVKDILEEKESQADSVQKIAHHLSKKEQEAEKKYSKTINIEGEEKIIFSVKSGLLVQALQGYDSNLYYLLAKIEYDKFIEEKVWEMRQGLPLEKHILKSCLFKIEKTTISDDIRIYDSNPRIARYWWDDFLELDPKRTNEENTIIVERAFEKELSKSIKKLSYFDYSALIDRLHQYLQTHREFDFDNLLKEVFETYQAKNKKIVIRNLIAPLRSLPERGGFDKNFIIIHEQLRDKIKFIFNLHDKIDLHVKDKLENLENIIKTEKDANRDKWLKIKISDNTYKRFTV